MIVSQPREALWAWLNARIGIPWSSDFRAIGVVRDGCLKAVVGYNGFMGRVCVMHNAIDDPAVIDRTFVRAVFEYPFIQLNLGMVLAPVPADNTKAMSLDTRVGFKQLVTLPGMDEEGKDLIFLAMRRDECRWIKGALNGRKEQPGGAGLHRGSAGAGSGQQRELDAADLGQPA